MASIMSSFDINIRLPYIHYFTHCSFLHRFCKHTDENKRQKVALILDKLITMTIDEEEMYPSIQAKIWGNIGQVSDLLDMVLDSFIKVCMIIAPECENMFGTGLFYADSIAGYLEKKVEF